MTDCTNTLVYCPEIAKEICIVECGFLFGVEILHYPPESNEYWQFKKILLGYVSRLNLANTVALLGISPSHCASANKLSLLNLPSKISGACLSVSEKDHKGWRVAWVRPLENKLLLGKTLRTSLKEETND